MEFISQWNSLSQRCICGLLKSTRFTEEANIHHLGERGGYVAWLDPPAGHGCCHSICRPNEPCSRMRYPTTVAVQSGRIIAIHRTIPTEDSFSEYCILPTILPGPVDTHVHLNEPGRTSMEWFWKCPEVRLQVVSPPLSTCRCQLEGQNPGGEILELG